MRGQQHRTRRTPCARRPAGWSPCTRRRPAPVRGSTAESRWTLRRPARSASTPDRRSQAFPSDPYLRASIVVTSRRRRCRRSCCWSTPSRWLVAKSWSIAATTWSSAVMWWWPASSRSRGPRSWPTSGSPSWSPRSPAPSSGWRSSSDGRSWLHGRSRRRRLRCHGRLDGRRGTGALDGGGVAGPATAGTGAATAGPNGVDIPVATAVPPDSASTIRVPRAAGAANRARRAGPVRGLGPHGSAHRRRPAGEPGRRGRHAGRGGCRSSLAGLPPQRARGGTPRPS